jgi:thymidine kinase
MFVEPHRSPGNRGWIEVICGSMFSGKTEELIRRLRRAQIAHQRVEIFKPALDTRYSIAEVVSHDSTTVRSTPVENAESILLLAGDAEVVGIDEAQFFNEELPSVLAKLAADGRRVIAAGLDTDFRGRPFGPMPALLASAEYITKLHAICMRCGDIANFSYRVTGHDSQVLLGEKDVYEPLCRGCFMKAGGGSERGTI